MSDQLASFVVWFWNIGFRLVGSGRTRLLWWFAGIRLWEFVGDAHRKSRLIRGQSWLYPPQVVVQKGKNCRATSEGDRDSRDPCKRSNFPSCDGEDSNERLLLLAARFVVLGAQN